jgi:ESS family glutamate:Na+ symporter
VTGGVVASVGFGLLHLVAGVDVAFSEGYRDSLLVVFFTCVGLETDVRSIVRGGRVLGWLAALAVLYLFLQSLLGVGVARLFGVDPNLGVVAGSASLQGGHGNIVAWAPILSSNYGVTGAMEIGMATATLGLILGGLLGGPVAEHLIRRNRLETSDDPRVHVGKKRGATLAIDYDSALKVILMVAVSIGLGIRLHDLLADLGLPMPLFVTCMFSGGVVANVVPLVVPRMTCPPGSPTLAVTSELSLGLFLATAMMALRFWEIGGHAVFILVNLAVQVVLIVLFATLVLFRILGRNYDAAVITSGYLGSALGATPTAMANMAAVTQKFGASRVAFIAIPIVAAFVTQFTNSVVIQVLLQLIN